jgi:mannose-6-phosphate isomerase-like protein (cupin superfamily)
MFIKNLKDCDEFIAKDLTILRQLLHPDKADLAIRYSLAHAVLHAGKASQPHRLKRSEVYYILEGEGIMHINDETEKIHANQVIYIPPCARQWIENRGTSDLKFLCIVDPAWSEEDEEVF